MRDVSTREAGGSVLSVSGASGPVARSFDEERAHVVAAYECDADLVDAVVPYLAGALSGCGTAIVIATPEHRRAFTTALEARGLACDELERAGRYRVLDARGTLDRLMVDGCPDGRAFADVVSGMCATAARAGGPLRVYGEMVALLWEAGELTAALELEALWNELAEGHAFALFCAYSLSSLDGAADLAATKTICDRHTAVAPLPLRIPVGGADVPDEVTRLFLAAPTAPQDVRAFVRSTLGAWGVSGLDGEFEIVASELATNAVRHARSPFRVVLTRRDSAIRIAVRDASSDAPECQTRDHSALGGRGVRLVAALSDGWGTEPEIDGKTVWAEFARSA